ncbi:MAG: hypothetical protein CSA76_02915 [Spirochaetales bacterium]|nr:MAG: hypothetical protein CSA76_02915 [Spirochaetales bacterium]
MEQTLKAVKDKGTYWRLLGIKYMDYEMWKEALKAFDEALAIYPDFAGIQYHRALCASQLALASPELSGRREYLAQAEAGYRRALAVDPRNTQSMYALAVLLVFELERPLEALPLLEDYLKIERSSIPARFLLARVYLQAGNAQAALDLYEHIEKNARESGDRDKAAELYRRVMGGNYGS